MTSSPSIRDTLIGHTFAAGLAPGHLDTLASLATIAEFASGSWITRQGQPASRFFLLVEGRAAVEVTAPGHTPLVIATVHADEVFGWSWLFPPHRWHFDVLALDDVRVLTFDANALREACDADHDLGYEVVRRLAGVIASRLEATRLQLVDVYGQPR